VKIQLGEDIETPTAGWMLCLLRDCLTGACVSARNHGLRLDIERSALCRRLWLKAV